MFQPANETTQSSQPHGWIAIADAVYTWVGPMITRPGRQPQVQSPAVERLLKEFR